MNHMFPEKQTVMVMMERNPRESHAFSYFRLCTSKLFWAPNLLLDPISH